MTELFDRDIRVTVGPVAGGPGKEWGRDGLLTIGFKVDKTDKSKPNQAEIQLTNLAKESAGYIGGSDLAVRLFAGYKSTGGAPLIFRGEITEVETGKDGLEGITTITARDGLRKFQAGMLSESFAAGVSSNQIITRVAAAMDLKVGAFPAELGDISYPSGYTVMGPGRATLDEVLKSLGAIWSIQDDTLMVTMQAASTSVSAFRIAEGTGLIGEPKKTKVGVKFDSLLQGAITPRGLVRLDSAVKPELSGWVVPKTVTHVGSSRDSDYRTEVEGFFITPAGA